MPNPKTSNTAPLPPASPLGASPARFEYHWNRERLRRLAWIIAILTQGLLIGVLLNWRVSPVFADIAVIPLLIAAWIVARRSKDDSPVVIIDRCGILDRRLKADPIYWSDIAAIAPCDRQRSHVLDLYIQLPKTRLASASAASRLGAAVQNRTGIPALTVSLLLLDCDLRDFAAAIAEFRPSLLPRDLRN